MALDVNEIRNGIREMLQLALDSVNCLNHFCRPLLVKRKAVRLLAGGRRLVSGIFIGQ